MAATLRPYQIEAMEAVRSDWNGAHPSTLLVTATGGGKTVILLRVLIDEVIACNGRGLVLVHRDELVEQPRARIRQFWPEWDRLSGTIQGKENDIDARLTIASVQSLIQPRRMKVLLANGPITHVVIDEAHHATANTYKSIIEQLRAANPELRLLGVTATPVRSDKKGLVEMFSHVAARYDIRLLVKLGYLVPPRGMAVETGADISKTKKGGEYDGESVAQIYGKANVWELVVESHKKYASDRKSSICFTPDVKSAYDLAEAFRKAGISAEAADGTTPTDERRKILERFRSGKTQVIANCNIWTEGVDIPQIDCVHWCRPTTSDSLYIQGIGRGLRTYPGKDSCLVLDYAPADYRNIVLAGDILGRLSSTGGDLDEEESSEGQREHAGEAFAVDNQGNLDFGDPSKLIARSLDYLNASPFEWHLEGDWASLSIQGWNHEYKSSLVIYPSRRGECVLALVNDFGRSTTPTVLTLAKGDDLQSLVMQGNHYAEKHADQALAQRGRGWRSGPVSAKQQSILRWYDVPADRIECLKAGEASRIITHYQAVKSIERYAQEIVRL